MVRMVTTKTTEKIVYIPLNIIHANPYQTRLKVYDEDLESLVSSIRKIGVINPITVRRHPKKMNEFQLVSGHRRVRASKIAGLTEIPALLKEIDDKEMAAECLVENMRRKQLSVIEEARGYRELLKLGHTLKEISTIAGKSRPAISNALRLLRLDPFVQLAVLHKTITPWHARTILALPEDIEQYRVVDLITDWNLTIKELKKIVQDILNGEELISWRRQVPLSGLFCPHERKNDCFDIDLYDSMKTQGQLNPIQVLVTGLILNGEKRTMVAEKLGWKEIDANVFFSVDLFRKSPDEQVIFIQSPIPVPKGIHPQMSQQQRVRMKTFSRHLKQLIQSSSYDMLRN